VVTKIRGVMGMGMALLGGSAVAVAQHSSGSESRGSRMESGLCRQGASSRGGSARCIEHIYLIGIMGVYFEFRRGCSSCAGRISHGGATFESRIGRSTA
ncbi:hypothetical protein B0H11DRAFT_1988617, partial [Mycena galericulata]